MQENLDAHALARLAIEAAPHADLLTRIGAHFDTVLRAAAILNNDWAEIEAAMQAAQSAPEGLRAAFYKTVWETYGRRHGLAPDLMGALAGERRKLGAIEHKETPAPIPAPKVEPAKEAKGPDPRFKVLGECQALIVQIGLGPTELGRALKEGGLKITENVLSAIRTGKMAGYMEARSSFTISAHKLEALKTGLELLILERESKQVALPLIPEAQGSPSAPGSVEAEPPQSLPQTTQAPQRRRATPPASRKEREALVLEMVKRRGSVKANDVARALELNIGAAFGMLNDMSELKFCGQGTYRLA